MAMVSGRGTDMWRRSSRLDNRVSLMWAADGRMTLVSFEGGAITYTGKRAGGADHFGRKARTGKGGCLGGPGW